MKHMNTELIRYTDVINKLNCIERQKPRKYARFRLHVGNLDLIIGATTNL